MCADRTRDERGFTLLEVLVAAVIAALALGALYQGSLAGILAARTAGQVQEATSRARSRLAMVGHGAPVIPGEQQGDDGGGFRWRVRVVALGTAPASRGDAAQLARGPRAALYGVTVWVMWRAGAARQVRLDTQVTDTAPPPPQGALPGGRP